MVSSLSPPATTSESWGVNNNGSCPNLQELFSSQLGHLKLVHGCPARVLLFSNHYCLGQASVRATGLQGEQTRTPRGIDWGCYLHRSHQLLCLWHMEDMSSHTLGGFSRKSVPAGIPSLSPFLLCQFVGIF